jgi:hypothetical protein
MDYQILSARQLEQVHLQKLLALETDHARLDLDLRLARAVGLDNDDMVTVQHQLAVIVQQMATLLSWITPPPPEDEEHDDEDEIVVSSNGDRAAVD